MSDNNKTTISCGGVSGIGLGGAMFLIFMTLKLCGVISWSWWWVTAPLWIPWLIFIAVFIGTIVFAGICFVIAAMME